MSNWRDLHDIIVWKTDIQRNCKKNADEMKTSEIKQKRLRAILTDLGIFLDDGDHALEKICQLCKNKTSREY